ncbi:hypothetical protein [Hydrogenivirga sp. 128-5-R1-1]|uniref:hypothetical protein n=1 Tax=Hydrogenivirga sp. 128-5-R1-1 TaxID=392423 RepID=UPI00015F15BF|nr:hypothetical protein [Hydrogenivirga sp. 128-5-R1-1]EDP74728.1 hypothetical protein HG1285_08559 [Hydrogenivirga sp. 128-5-R1-1]
MNLISRGLLALASLLLIGVFFVPLWKITLTAPQYPEGLGMLIWVNDITGEKPHDLYNINLLNHYIGMKYIEPEKIPELKVMPIIFGFMVILGLIGAVTGKRKILKVWVLLFVVFGVLGIIDFYRWEYDYGHNLDPNAPLKIPGLAYQPPLIGCKTLLNMQACSWPDTGAYIAVVSLVLGVLALVVSRLGERTTSYEAVQT